MIYTNRPGLQAGGVSCPTLSGNQSQWVIPIIVDYWLRPNVRQNWRWSQLEDIFVFTWMCVSPAQNYIPSLQADSNICEFLKNFSFYGNWGHTIINRHIHPWFEKGFRERNIPFAGPIKEATVFDIEWSCIEAPMKTSRCLLWKCKSGGWN